MTFDEITILHAKTLDFFYKNHTFTQQLPCNTSPKTYILHAYSIAFGFKEH